MYAFHASIHARPGEVAAGSEILLRGQTLPTLSIAPSTIGATPMACTFEQAQDGLARLARMFIEPDGSFVWVSGQGEPAWQVDGNLYDRAERLLFVDAKGTCPAAEFDRLLAALGWPTTPLVFQLVREAVLLAEPTFRQWAQMAAGA